MTGAESRAGLPIVAFADPAALEGWLAAQPPTSAGAWLKLAKKGLGPAGLTRAEAVDALLCHGWIDGQQDRYDEASWLVRVTPRKRGSRWSEVNRTRATALIEAGRMRPAGLREIEAARADGRWDAAYAPASTARACPALQAALDRHEAAAVRFAALPAAQRYSLLYRLATLKRAESRARLIAEFVQASATIAVTMPASVHPSPDRSRRRTVPPARSVRSAR